MPDRTQAIAADRDRPPGDRPIGNGSRALAGAQGEAVPGAVPAGDGPLTLTAIAGLAGRIEAIDPRMDPRRVAHRLIELAETMLLTGENPEPDLYEIAGALAMWGRWRALLSRNGGG